MADRFFSQIEGGKQLDKNLANLERKIQRKIVRRALALASAPILRAAKAKLPKRGAVRTYTATNSRGISRTFTQRTSGTLRKSISRKTVFSKAYRDATVRIFASRKKGGHHAHLVELGTRGWSGTITRRTASGRTISYNLTIPARTAKPFLRPTFDSRKAKSLGIIETEIRRGIGEVRY